MWFGYTLFSDYISNQSGKHKFSEFAYLFSKWSPVMDDREHLDIYTTVILE